MRIATFLIAGLGTAAWLILIGLALLSASDPAATDLGMTAGVAVTVAYCLTAVPSLVLSLANRAPRAAFALAVAFPLLLALLFAMALTAFET